MPLHPHICGLVWCWSTFPFEDFNGFVKDHVNGNNKLDQEIVHALKICNSYIILKHVVDSKNEKKGFSWKRINIQKIFWINVKQKL